MQDQSPAELLQRLLDACNDGSRGAMRLAQQTEVATLRAFLQESARQYRAAADDLRAVGRLDPHPGHAGNPAPLPVTVRARDVASTWERTECEALTYFRDVYDAADGVLPSPVAQTVKRHFEAGVNRLERLRELRSRLS